MEHIGSAKKIKIKVSLPLGEEHSGQREQQYRKPDNKSVSLECVRNAAGAGMEHVKSKDYKNNAGEEPWSQSGKALVRTWYGQLNS